MEDTNESALKIQALVLFVHGTFAGDPSDEGEKWWQIGSSSYQALASRVPDCVRLQEQGEVFHWSGANSDHARWSAGRALLSHIRAIRRRGLRVHLIGHSHGGSVIWNALRFKEEPGRLVKRVDSWTTVGMPFIQFKPGCGQFANLFTLAIGAAMFIPAALSLAGLVIMFVTVSLDLGLSLPTATGAASVGGIIAVNLAIFVGGVRLIAKADDVVRAHAEEKAAQEAMDSNGKGWLGIWSESDEAIKGLRASVDMTGSIVPRRTIAAHRLVTGKSWSERLTLVLVSFTWIFNLVFNYTAAPAADRFLTAQLKRAAQGDDRPGAVVTDVTAGPVADFNCQPLPQVVSAELVSIADDQLVNWLPHVRNAIANIAVSGPQMASLNLEQANYSDQTGLVHNAYFEHPDVVELIALRISELEGESSEERSDLRKWLDQSQSEIQEYVERPRSFWQRLFG